MTLEKLPIEIQSMLNASVKIRCFNKAVEELVYNSLDAEATSIAIRIDIHESFIQVVDNGNGISKANIPLLGQRYSSSKISDASAFKSAPKNYGFRGESLSNIIETSERVKVTTRYKEKRETWVKYFINGQYKDSYQNRMRPSKGTTVEVKGFLYNLHIPKETTNELNELEKIKSFLQKMSLVNTNVSLSFRDDSCNEILFKIHKKRDLYQSLSSLFGIDKNDLQELQIEKNQYKAKGYIGKQKGEPKSYRWIYLNGRFIYKSVLNDIIDSNFFTNKQLYNEVEVKHHSHKSEYKKHTNLNITPTYFIFISCPYFDYDVNFTSLKTIVEFKNWNQIKSLLEKLVKFYRGDINLKETKLDQPNNKRDLENTREQVKRIMEKVLGTKSKNQMQMYRGVKGKIVKKKLKNSVTDKLKKVKATIQKRATENDFFALPKTKNFTLCNNLQAEKYKTFSACTLKEQNLSSKKSVNIKKKSLKHLNEEIKFKTKSNVNAEIKHHSKEANIITNKNKFYIDNLRMHNGFDEIENSVYGNMLRKHTLKKNNNITPQKRKCNTLCNKHKQLAPNNHNDDVVKYNNCLKSCDLVKTILNSQKDYNPLDGVDSMYYKIKHKCSEYLDQCYMYNESLNNIDSYISTTYNEKLTFESHKYNKEHTVSIENFNRLKKLFTEKSKASLSFHKKIVESLNDGTSDKQYTKSNDLSQAIELTNSYSIVNNFKNNKCECNKHSSKTYDQYKYKHATSIQNTYTIINSNVSLNVGNYISNVNNKEYLEPIFSFHREDKSSNILNDTENHEPLLQINNKDENNLEVLLISSSKNSTSPIMSNENFAPLNLCEAVYHNASTNNDVDVNKGILKIKTMTENDIDLIGISDTETENISRHFRKNNNDPNLKTKDFNNELIDVLQSETDKDTRNFNQEYNQYIDSAEIVSNRINHDNQTSNKFKLKNRFNFVPKGMSPIFENCQTKNICSHNIEMDYYEDDLYHNFANDVLHNFKTFENGITNINDIGTKKLNKDYVCLKFNAESLKKAKVFGQVDQKFILAELHSDSLKMKHLVLFDQHAVHERIRLENNLSEYKNGDQWTSMKCETLCLKLSKDVILYMNNFRDKFEQFGLQWKIENECEVAISTIPKALFGKNCREADTILSSIKSLILEEIKAIKCIGGNTSLYPKSIMDLVFNEEQSNLPNCSISYTGILFASSYHHVLDLNFSRAHSLLVVYPHQSNNYIQACRYAIKFGDKLSKTECATLISSLSNCKTPFQCAHGRPVMAVLIDLKNTCNHYRVDKPKILMFRNKTMLK